MRDNKDIGIMTVGPGYFLMNYGSFFQHFALRQVLMQLGYRPRRISSHGYFKFLYYFWIVPLRGWKNLRVRRWIWMFRFVRDYHRAIGRIYEISVRQPFRYVVGSDAIWMYDNPAFFLADKKYSAPKIAYAVSTSWDKSQLETWWRERMKIVGETYRAVAAREEVGREVCQKLMPKLKVECVIDPTLLLVKEDYEKVIRSHKYFNRPTLFYYAVNIWTEKDLNLDCLKSVAKTLDCDLKIVGIQGAENFIPKEYAVAPSPLDFLRCIRDGKYVVTNSFHGVALSIVFRKQFAFVTQETHLYGDQNCRQDGLLRKTGLIDRRVSSLNLSGDALVRVLTLGVDEKTVGVRVGQERLHSISWLLEALV